MSILRNEMRNQTYIRCDWVGCGEHFDIHRERDPQHAHRACADKGWLVNGRGHFCVKHSAEITESS